MANLMDRTPFNSGTQVCSFANNIPCDLQNIIQQARQNPRAFEEYVRQNNPQAFQQAMALRNSGNPKAAIMQMLQAKGLPMNILSMFGL